MSAKLPEDTSYKIRRISKEDSATAEQYSQSVNRVGDRLWLLDDQRGIQFDTSFESWGNVDEKYLTMQRLLMYCGTGGRMYSDDANRISVSARKTFLSLECSIQKVLQNWRKNKFLDALPMQSWSIDDIVNSLRQIHAEVATRETIPSFGSLPDIIYTINKIFVGCAKGSLTDGILYPINHATKKAIVDPLLIAHGIHFSEYVKGKMFSSLPITHAMTGLAEAVRLFDSEKTKFALALFSAWREYPQFAEPIDIWKQLHNRELYKLGHKRKEYKQIRNFQDLLFTKTTLEYDDLPWKTWGEFASYVGEVIDACVFVLLTLTGIRSHELIQLRVENWERDTSGVWYFRSAEDKVNAGGLYDRAIVGLGARAAEIVKHLGWVDPEKPRPLFGPWHGSEASYYARATAAGSNYTAKKAIAAIQKTKNRFEKKTARGRQYPDDRLKAFYRRHVVEKHPELGATHPDTHPDAAGQGRPLPAGKRPPR